MFRYLSFLLVVSTHGIELSAESYDSIPLEEDKRTWIETIKKKAALEKNSTYPLQRVIETITADDCDYIPKVYQGGLVFEENGIRYQYMHNGIILLADRFYGSWITDIIYGLKGHHEPQEEKVFYEVLKYMPPGATIIELGSYWGFYSLWFLKEIENGLAFLIEPDLKNMEVGRANFSLNKKQGHFFMGYIKANENDRSAFPYANSILIDEFIQTNNLYHVNILHSDIQGAEYQMLLSCKESITRRGIDYFFISTHSPELHLMCRTCLIESKYRIIAEHEMSESCSFDGLIVARRDELDGPDSITVRKYSRN